MKQIQQKLFTKEDPYHVHKTLGLVALSSYIYRISNFGASDMGFSPTKESSDDFYVITLLTLLVHVCLNISSFEFHIPAKRIQSDGGRIWPQYRFHSLVFSCRGLLCIALNAFYYNALKSSQSPLGSSFTLPHGNYLIVIATMIIGDIASNYWVQYPSNSIRDLKASPVIKYYFSVMQFLATGVSLVGLRRCSLHYYMVMVVQVTAFLMTLRRKNLVSHETNVILYALLLAGGFVVGIYETYVWDPAQELLWISAFLGMTAAVLRILCGMNKYVIWTMLHIVNCYCFLPSIQSQEANLHSMILLSLVRIRWLGVSATMIMVLGGLWRSYFSSTQIKSISD
ncbi:hypothetical protein FisN_22Hu218 [Fistulifera solaris]|uniref:Uncharacterized protein n=1 Tax=Fistulifera solaris TaxID=1519565 RepID=A0A1Z5JQ12_FISSO|nr:hypothetical protein FisN_22Hu218 [Fistulifera solaris]|eukprot:GAX15932.1 hypothetical protein FisN_22Hu218 [Fistulifera solaris]